jgi:hypothetical protein
MVQAQVTTTALTRVQIARGQFLAEPLTRLRGSDVSGGPLARVALLVDGGEPVLAFEFEDRTVVYATPSDDFESAEAFTPPLVGDRPRTARPSGSGRYVAVQTDGEVLVFDREATGLLGIPFDRAFDREVELRWFNETLFVEAPDGVYRFRVTDEQAERLVEDARLLGFSTFGTPLVRLSDGSLASVGGGEPIPLSPPGQSATLVDATQTEVFLAYADAGITTLARTTLGGTESATVATLSGAVRFSPPSTGRAFVYESSTRTVYEWRTGAGEVTPVGSSGLPSVLGVRFLSERGAVVLTGPNRLEVFELNRGDVEPTTLEVGGTIFDVAFDESSLVLTNGVIVPLDGGTPSDPIVGRWSRIGDEFVVAREVETSSLFALDEDGPRSVGGVADGQVRAVRSVLDGRAALAWRDTSTQLVPLDPLLTIDPVDFGPDAQLLASSSQEVVLETSDGEVTAWRPLEGGRSLSVSDGPPDTPAPQVAFGPSPEPDTVQPLYRVWFADGRAVHAQQLMPPRGGRGLEPFDVEDNRAAFLDGTDLVLVEGSAPPRAIAAASTGLGVTLVPGRNRALLSVFVSAMAIDRVEDLLVVDLRNGSLRPLRNVPTLPFDPSPSAFGPVRPLVVGGSVLTLSPLSLIGLDGEQVRAVQGTSESSFVQAAPAALGAAVSPGGARVAACEGTSPDAPSLYAFSLLTDGAPIGPGPPCSNARVTGWLTDQPVAYVPEQSAWVGDRLLYDARPVTGALPADDGTLWVTTRDAGLERQPLVGPALPVLDPSDAVLSLFAVP